MILVDVSLVGPSWCLPLWPRSRTGAVWGSHGGVGVTRAPPVLCRICVPFYFVSWRMRGCEPWGWLNPQAPSEEDQELLLVPMPLLGLFFFPWGSPKRKPVTSLPPNSSCPLPYPSIPVGAEWGEDMGWAGRLPPSFCPLFKHGDSSQIFGIFSGRFTSVWGFGRGKRIKNPSVQLTKKINIFTVEVINKGHFTLN